MQVKYLISIFILISIVAFSGNEALAQSKSSKLPDRTMSVGVRLDGGSIESIGGTIGYALDEKKHIGTRFGFFYDGGTDNSDSETFLILAPYFKMFLMDAVRNFRMFGMAEFEFTTLSQTYIDNDNFQQEATRTVSSTGLAFSAGAEWFPYSSIGVYGIIRVIEIQLDPMRFIGGIGMASIGVEWFL